MGNNALRKVIVITSIVAVVSLTIAGIIGAVTGVGKTIASPGFWTDDYPRSGEITIDERKSVPLGQTSRIEIRTISENIVVRTGEGDSIEAWLHGAINKMPPENRPHLRIDRNGNTVRIFPEWNNRLQSHRWIKDAKLEVSIPLKYNGNLSAESISSDIEMENHSYSGLTLNTISGDINARSLTCDQSDVHSTSGEVALAFTKMPVRTAVDTISGGVRLEIPSKTGFTLDARSTSGDVSCDFPVLITGSHTGPGEHSLAGTVGSGKNSVTVRTISGDIEIVRKGGI